jgi:hypothetical protein
MRPWRRHVLPAPLLARQVEDQPPQLTFTCTSDQHELCAGYIAPLVYSNTRPCVCSCHDEDNPRNWPAAEERAHASYYGDAR